MNGQAVRAAGLEAITVLAEGSPAAVTIFDPVAAGLTPFIFPGEPGAIGSVQPEYLPIRFRGDGAAWTSVGFADPSMNTIRLDAQGGAGSDQYRGAAASDTLFGGGGNDTLVGGGGADIMGGDAGLEANLLSPESRGDGSLDGGDGNDTLSGGEGSDTLRGGAGLDDLAGGPGDDVLHLDAAEPDRADGGDGTGDWLILEGSPGGRVSVDLTLPDQITSIGDRPDAGPQSGFERVNASGLSGPNASAHLQGNVADNYLVGATGADLIWGGAGNDTIEGAGGADTLGGSTGVDLFILRKGKADGVLIGDYYWEDYILLVGFGQGAFAELSNDALRVTAADGSLETIQLPVGTFLELDRNVVFQI